MSIASIKLSPPQLLWILDLFVKDSGRRTIYGKWERSHPLVLTGVAEIEYTTNDRTASTVVALTKKGEGICAAMIGAGTEALLGHQGAAGK